MTEEESPQPPGRVPWDMLIKLIEKIAITSALVTLVGLGKMEIEACIAILAGVYGIPKALSGIKKAQERKPKKPKEVAP